MKNRSQARKFSFQFLYHIIFSQEKVNLNDIQLRNEINLFSDSISLPDGEDNFVIELLSKSIERENEIENIITQTLKKGRVDPISKSILFLAITEMKFLKKKTPGKVVINEYVELAKEFGTKETKSFINGTLDRVYNEL